ncbi:murein biosynthesis integral membrane protein MurJ [bacterium]|nr:murein biosynthesis integral membrane protein MurJ [bacterium]
METIEESQELKPKSKIKSLLLRQSFFQASILLMFFSFLSKALGYVREMAIAGYFGARYFTDAFFLAQIIPLLGGTLVTMAFPLVFIPFYLSEREKSEESAQKLASSIFWGVILYSILAIFLIILFSWPICRAIAPGFSDVQLSLLRRFLIVLSPLIFFQSLAGFFTAYLQARKHFLSPAFAGFLVNIPIISFLFLLARQLPFESLAIGFNLGYFAYSFVLFPFALLFGFNPFASFNFFHPHIKRFFLLLLPIVIGSSLSYIDMLIARALASKVGEGVVSALNYSYRLMGIPLGIMAGSIGTAVFPFMSSKAALLDSEAVAKETTRGLYATWLISLPVGVFFFVLSQPVIRLMFERGAFTAEATKITADMLAFFSLGIPAMTGWGIATRAFYSLQDTITPLKIGFYQILIDLVLLFTLPQIIGYKGLPLATSISISVGFSILWLTLSKRLPQLRKERIVVSFGKAVMMCLIQGFSLYYICLHFRITTRTGFARELSLLATLGIISFLIYIGAGIMMRYPDISIVTRKIDKIFRKS